jgi:hypothetical protein
MKWIKKIEDGRKGWWITMMGWNGRWKWWWGEVDEKRRVKKKDWSEIGRLNEKNNGRIKGTMRNERNDGTMGGSKEWEEQWMIKGAKGTMGGSRMKGQWKDQKIKRNEQWDDQKERRNNGRNERTMGIKGN